MSLIKKIPLPFLKRALHNTAVKRNMLLDLPTDEEVARQVQSCPEHFGISEFLEQMTQANAICAVIPNNGSTQNGTVYPTNANATGSTVQTGIDMSVLRRLLTIANVGTVTTSNVQLYYIASANANMAGNVNVASSIPLTANTSNRLEMLEVRADQLPAGTRYAAPVLVVNTLATAVDLICLGSASSYHPANQFNTLNLVDKAIIT